MPSPVLPPGSSALSPRWFGPSRRRRSLCSLLAIVQVQLGPQRGQEKAPWKRRPRRAVPSEGPLGLSAAAANLVDVCLQLRRSVELVARQAELALACQALARRLDELQARCQCRLAHGPRLQSDEALGQDVQQRLEVALGPGRECGAQRAHLLKPSS